MDGLLHIDASSLRVFARRTNVFFRYIVSLYHDHILLGYHSQDPAGGAFMVAGDNLNHIIFFHVLCHLLLPGIRPEADVQTTSLANEIIFI